jgi:hypothetical protein
VIRRAWFLNLDADVELGHSHGYTPGRRIQHYVTRHRAACAALTVGDPVCGDDAFDPKLPVFAWCPTPNALATLHDWGLAAVRGPGVDALRRANDRAWTAAFADPQLGRRFVTAADDWQRLLFENRSATGSWRLKRRFGFAGRGQRRLRGRPSGDDLRWIAASLAQGGLLCEAELPVLEEFSIHGYVDPSQLLLGTPVAFATDAFGAPTEHAALALGRGDLTQALEQAATAVAARLETYGYFGPFGVDAFTWRSEGAAVLNPVSDVNARFTLAWSTGMGPSRERALQCYAEWSAEAASTRAM